MSIVRHPSPFDHPHMFCRPLPWTASNALFASVDSVSFTQFMLATTVILPKVFVAVFVGSRLAMLADGEELDATAKWINSISIVVAVATTAITGVYVLSFRLPHLWCGA